MAWQQQQGPYDSPYTDATPNAFPTNGHKGGFKSHDLDDDSFGAKSGIVSAFDAFRTVNPSFVGARAPRPRRAFFFFLVTRNSGGCMLTALFLQQNRNPNMSPEPLAAESGRSP